MVLDGKKASTDLFSRLAPVIKKINKELAVIQIGENPASTTYINIKRKKSEELGIVFKHIQLPVSVTNQDVLNEIQKLNNDTAIGGILLQLPIPEHLDKQMLLDAISPQKDIDCLGSTNLGRFFTGDGKVMPATVRGVLALFEYFNISLESKDICIIGASNLVGKPLALALTNKEATVTLCHIKTNDVVKYSSQADIVITATGTPNFFTEKYFAKKQTVIDIGLSKAEDGKLYGDVDHQNVDGIVANITPVPGGVGPMTVYGLIENFVTLNL